MRSLTPVPNADDQLLPCGLIMLVANEPDLPRYFEHHWMQPVRWGQVEEALRAQLAFHDRTSAYDLIAVVPDVSPGPEFVVVHRGMSRNEVVQLAADLLRAAGAFT